MLQSRVAHRAGCPLAFAFVLGLACSTASAAEPHKFLLWPDGAPQAMGETEKDQPSLTVYVPDEANGCAVVVCPGGGYGGLAVDHEGRAIGEWLSELGVTAFVLRYRLNPYRHPVPLMDAQRALRTVRARASEWDVDPQRIGILGFSAGGHLASTAGTHFDKGDASAADPIERVSCRPDFLVLCYGVITLEDPHTHAGSRRNLLGTEPDPDLVQQLSNNLQVTKETPPTFLWHTNEDTAVPPENSVLFYLGCRKAGVPAELHIFEPGRHGVGLAPGHPVLSKWPELCEAWLRNRKLLETPQQKSEGR